MRALPFLPWTSKGHRPNQGHSPETSWMVSAGQSPRRTSGGEAETMDSQTLDMLRLALDMLRLILDMPRVLSATALMRFTMSYPPKVTT